MSIDYEPFVAAADDIAAERGEFAIFALILREDLADLVSISPGDPTNVGRWDVLMSAAWLAPDRHAPLKYVAEKIQKHGGKTALLSIAVLRALPVSHPVVKRIMNELQLPRPVSTGGRAPGRMQVLDPSVIGPGVSRAIAVTATEDARVARARPGKNHREVEEIGAKRNRS